MTYCFKNYSFLYQGGLTSTLLMFKYFAYALADFIFLITVLSSSKEKTPNSIIITSLFFISSISFSLSIFFPSLLTEVLASLFMEVFFQFCYVKLLLTNSTFSQPNPDNYMVVALNYIVFYGIIDFFYHLCAKPIKKNQTIITKRYVSFSMNPT